MGRGGGGCDGDTQLPLRGVVLCFTSIDPETRTQLASWAAEMGADHKLDLTSDVTHLIVGETQTPKYRYVAKEREDVKCLDSGWIASLRAVWMTGADVLLEELEDKHRLQTFHELKICITGFEDPDQRKELETQITRHGGEYRGDLRKDCTHLICFSPAGAKYTSAKSWGNIRTVSVEWMSMSIERGLVLDEQFFDPLLPSEERGKGAWKRTARKSPTLKRTCTDDIKSIGPRKLRRAASTRFSTDSVWQEIVPSVPSELSNNITGLKRTVSVPITNSETTTTNLIQQLPTPQPSNLNRIINRAGIAITKSETRRGIFNGKRFLLRGFDDRRVRLLRQHLESHDGEVQSDETIFSQQLRSSEPDSSFTIVPHVFPAEGRSAPPSFPASELMTELWVEKCLHKKAFIDPHSNPAHKPFNHPISGFDKISISSTGFDGVDLMHIGKVLGLVGASYSEGLTKSTSLLICCTDSVVGEKYKHALSWNIPAVKVAWLWTCIHEGHLKPWDDYLVHPNLQRPRASVTTEAQASCTGAQAPQNGSSAKNKQLMGRPMRLSDRPQCDKPDPKGAIVTGNHNGIGHSTRPQGPGAHPEHDLRVAEPPRDVPLNELSPNLTGPNASPGPKRASYKTGGDQSLVTSLNTLLARSREHKSQPSFEGLQELPRKKRQLLGRARSDLSVKSSISCADSLESLNTDGMGTPLDAVSKASPRKSEPISAKGDNESLPFLADILLDRHENDEHLDAADSRSPALTQIGYDDADAAVWRARVAKKMSGSLEGNQIANYDEVSAAQKAVLKDAGGTISRRTRLNTK